MAGNLNSAEGLFAASICVILALAFASPAIAETTTLSCEGEQHVGASAAPWTGPIDIDYAASTVTFGAMQISQMPAVITDRKIEFQRREASYLKLWGVIDRLSGTLDVTAFLEPENWNIHARCRQATQKF